MRENISYYTTDKFTTALTSLAFFALIGTFLVLFLSFRALPPFIPFFNSLPWGGERLVATEVLYIFSAVLGVVFVLNILLGVGLYKRFTLLARILSFNSFLIVTLSFLAYVHILILVY